MTSLVLALGLLSPAIEPDPEPARRLDRIEVVARLPESPARRSEALALLDRDTIERIAATHPAEALARLPGVWLSRGSGQESLLAIRSPVLAGAGACGAFLLLEDGIPLRPSGFCNVNQAFELASEQAAAIELLRGPGSALHGSNALHGAINVRLPLPQDGAEVSWRVEAGNHALRRWRGSAADGERWRLDGHAVGSSSFRVDESVAQQKLAVQWRWPAAAGAPRLYLAASNLNQETAGYVAGEHAYRDARRRSNQNPEAFRDARAARLHGDWQWTDRHGDHWRLRPYARHDAMRFIQHFTPGKPLEDNGSDSAGLQLGWQRIGTWSSSLGVDLEWARGELLERQPLPIDSGSEALRAIRPAGTHYDYAVESRMLALFGQWQRPLGRRWWLQAGLRIERLQYDYDNRIAAGNLRDDGMPCGFGGCLFQRPADRRDAFGEPAAQLGLRFALSDDQHLRGRIARAFRFPQAGELYRLQRGQSVAELEPETLHGVELGWTFERDHLRVALDGYAYRKQHSVLRDAAGLLIADGASSHRGIELEASLAPAPWWRLDVHAGHARHRYASSHAIAGGERIDAGNEVDTAPRHQGGLRLHLLPPQLGRFELEWLHLGSYFTDAANQARYPGHDLLHLRWQRELAPDWRIAARLMNLTDRRYAERADFAFGEHRYFPGDGRSLFVELAWRSAR